MVRATDVPLAAFILLFFLFPVNLCLAFEKSIKTPEGILLAQPAGAVADTIALAPTTKEELLLFWEEKDLYVQSATRDAKPLSQVAENITVVTAKEIEDMNAHTLNEVFNRVTGVFVEYQGMDFGSTALVYIQSPSHRTDMSRHTLVLLDGVIFNVGQANAQLNEIPVGVIERIEIIKGPASSSWGSSLGGVINIITKDVGDTKRPSGIFSASYGESSTQDYNAGLAGKAGKLGYYFFAGRQSSDGLLRGLNRHFDKNSFYSKLSMPLSRDVSLGFSGGYNEADLGFGEQPAGDLASNGLIRDFFLTASLKASLTKELKLDISLYTFKQKFVLDSRALGSGLYNNPPGHVEAPGDPVYYNISEDESLGGSAKLVWTHGVHNVVLGTDLSHTSENAFRGFGPFFQTIGVPAEVKAGPTIDKFAVFANDTISIGRFSITPGIRHDHNTLTGDFTSPSLGATFKAGERTILRASVARGFTIPFLAGTSVGGYFFNPNPGLQSETVWSYQAGLESSVTEYVWAKATLFYHDLKNAVQKVYYAAGPPSYNDLFMNTGGIRREGLELEAETAPYHDLSLKAGFIYVRTISGPPPPAAPAPFPAPVPGASKNAIDVYSYKAGLKYDDRKSFMAELFGHYTWWDLLDDVKPKYDNVIWDFNLRKNIFSTDMSNTEFFLTVHNIFSASYYTLGDTKAPQSWAEAGVRVKF